MPLIFKHGIRRNATRVPQLRWKQHKELLCSLYREKTISEVVKIMKDEHDFLATEGQLGRKLHEWGVYKYESKHCMQLQVSAVPYNALNSEGFGPTTTIQTTQQCSSTRSLPPAISEESPLTASFEQIQDLPGDNWFSSVTRWLDSYEVGDQFNLCSLNLLNSPILELLPMARLWLSTVLKWLTKAIYQLTIFESRFGQSHVTAACKQFIKIIYEFTKMGVDGMIRFADFLSLGNFPQIVELIKEFSTEFLSFLDIYQTQLGHGADQPYCGEVDRISLDSSSRSSLADLASLESLSGRIHRNQMSALVNGQECASIRPSQVMRRKSFASSDLRLFDGISENLSTGG